MPRYSVTMSRGHTLRPGDLIAFYNGEVGRVVKIGTGGHIAHVRSLFWYEGLLLAVLGRWIDEWVEWD